MTEVATIGRGDIAAVIGAMREANGLLRKLGWRLLDVTANDATGFVRIIAECRDWTARDGVQILLLRGSHDGEVLEMRSRVQLVCGMYNSEWEVGEHLGRRRFASLPGAARELLSYACDNGPAGALTEAESRERSVLTGAEKNSGWMSSFQVTSRPRSEPILSRSIWLTYRNPNRTGCTGS
jgi:hypothetical protein